jgi:hypothetical protein
VAKALLIDEFHVTFFVPPGLAEAEYADVRRVLDQARFRADLRRAVRGVVANHPPLRKVRLRISR